MIKFTAKEYKYILNKMQENRKHFNTCTKEELVEWLKDNNGENYDTIMLFTTIYKLETINEIETLNNNLINYMLDVEKMWVWLEHDCDTNYIRELIDENEEYFSIYDKIYNNNN